MVVYFTGKTDSRALSQPRRCQSGTTKMHMKGLTHQSTKICALPWVGNLGEGHLDMSNFPKPALGRMKET